MHLEGNEVRITRIHINALVGLVLYALLIAGLIGVAAAMVWVLTVSKIDTNGHADILMVIVGALLPMINNTLREFVSVVKRFTYMSDDDEEE